MELTRFIFTMNSKDFELDVTDSKGKTFRGDAFYRDFRLNSIYYDLTKQEIVDPLGGIEDIKNRVIQSCASPDKCFKDGSRVIRAIRMTHNLDFRLSTDLKTYILNNFSGKCLRYEKPSK